MEQSSNTPIKAKKTPVKAKSSLLSQVDPCYVCKNKGGNQTCKTCKYKVCMDCIHEESRECNTCEFEHNIFKAKTRGKPQYADQFKPSQTAPSTPQQAKTPGRVQQLIWSAASRLFANNKKEEMAMTPVQPAMSMAAATTSTPAPTSPNTKELIRKLKSELKNVNALNAQLQAKLDETNEALSKKDTAVAAVENNNNNQTMIHSGGSAEGREEDRMQIVDLQIQLSEAVTNVRRLETELIMALEREQDLQDKNALLQAALQQARTQGGSSGQASTSSSSRSAIPPCPPLPGTRESIEWISQVKAGKEHPASAWLTDSASAAAAGDTTTSVDALSAALNGASLNAKKRSEIPVPPPLPAGMTVAPGRLTGMRLSLGAGRRGSAPGLLETVQHQQLRRPSIFALNEQAKLDLKPLYWSALDADRAQGTIFETLQDECKVRPEKMKKELLMLDQRFAKKPKASGAAATATMIAAQPVSQVSIMDGKRKQQLGILLNSSFRGVEFKTLRKAITNLDRQVLTDARVQQLLDMIPTVEETKNIQDLQSGNMLDAAFFARITREEQFFLDMSAIPRLKSRLQCVAIVAQLGTKMEQLVRDCDLFLQAVSAVRGGERWKQFLHLCLETGNYLNSGNANLSGAWGFKLKEGLTKLIETKSCENNSSFTLMHWIAQLASAHHPELFKLAEDFFVVNEASPLSVAEMQKELAEYTKQLDVVKEEIKHCSKINPEEASHAALLTNMKPFAEEMSKAMDLLKIQVENVVKESQNLVAMHGEDPKVDTCSELFKTILGGVYNFLKCKDDNVAQAARQQQQTDKAAVPQDSVNKSKAAAAAIVGKHGAGKPQESLIAQDTEFQMKMERQKAKRASNV